MPKSAALAVAEVLRQGLWRKFTHERERRRFVFQEARRKNEELDLMLLDCAGLSRLPHYRVDLWDRCGLQALAAGRDSIIRATLDFAGPLMDASGIGASETLLTVRKAISASGLTLDAQRVMYTKMQDYTREEAHIPLGMSPRRVAAAWRELNRKKGTFLKMLSPFRPPACTLH
jgi:hypothetical protein